TTDLAPKLAKHHQGCLLGQTYLCIHSAGHNPLMRSNDIQVIIASSLFGGRIRMLLESGEEGAKKEKEAECIPNTARQIRIKSLT
ncbi:unnamed protein product, partial [Urochloa humidicola]